MAGVSLHRDGEAGVCRHLKGLPRSMSIVFLGAIENNLARSLDNLHALGLASSEMKGTGKDDSDSLVLTFFGDDGVRDDLPLEVDIGLGVNGCISEFHNALIGFR